MGEALQSNVSTTSMIRLGSFILAEIGCFMNLLGSNGTIVFGLLMFCEKIRIKNDVSGLHQIKIWYHIRFYHDYANNS